jgi:hypothetical protein
MTWFGKCYRQNAWWAPVATARGSVVAWHLERALDAAKFSNYDVTVLSLKFC